MNRAEMHAYAEKLYTEGAVYDKNYKYRCPEEDDCGFSTDSRYQFLCHLNEKHYFHDTADCWRCKRPVKINYRGHRCYGVSPKFHERLLADMRQTGTSLAYRALNLYVGISKKMYSKTSIPCPFPECRYAAERMSILTHANETHVKYDQPVQFRDAVSKDGENKRKRISYDKYVETIVPCEEEGMSLDEDETETVEGDEEEVEIDEDGDERETKKQKTTQEQQHLSPIILKSATNQYIHCTDERCEELSFSSDPKRETAAVVMMRNVIKSRNRPPNSEFLKTHSKYEEGFEDLFTCQYCHRVHGPAYLCKALLSTSIELDRFFYV